MIDFKNKKIFKLKPDDSYGYKVSELLVGMRDWLQAINR